MLIPSIDLQGGKVVQLVQGERLAIETTTSTRWIARFAASRRCSSSISMRRRARATTTRSCDASAAELPCRVGGGIRRVERAQRGARAGATQVIVGSALFTDGRLDLAFAEALCATRSAPIASSPPSTAGAGRS